MKCPTCHNEFSDSVFPMHILRCTTVTVGDAEPIPEEPEAQEEMKTPPLAEEPKKRKR